ncbi:MAG: glycosyltransferase family 39 protein [Candidatus Omnitrophica bacterium]|nr:glycosyltransferase family 39 protein [Candidatus Omnitrophota bacterium]
MQINILVRKWVLAKMNMSRAIRIVNSRYAYLVGLTLLYLLVRLLVLFCAIDLVSLDEELYRGNISKELISGQAFPFFDYQRSEYEGGSLVSGILAVPFFLLFGDKLISLKFVGLLTGTGLFILWYLFLDRFFNRRVAVWTSLLLIFPQPGWIKASVSNYGALYEVNFFTMMAVLIFYQIFFVRKKKVLFGLLGVVCGFGMFFHYSFLPTLLTIILFWYIFDKKFFLKSEFFIFAAAFLTGLAPWIWYNLTHNFQGLIVCDHLLSHWFAGNNPVNFFLRLKNFFTIDMPGIFTFSDPILEFEPQALLGHWFLSRIYYFVFVISFCALSWLNRRSLLKIIRGIIPLPRFSVLPQEISKEVFLLVFFAVFVFTLSLSGIQFNMSYYESSVFRYRHVAPVGLFIPAMIVIFLYGKRTQFRSFFAPYLNFCIMAFLLGLGLVSNFNFISKDPLHKAALSGIYRGYNYYDLGRVIAWRFDGSSRWVDSIKGIKDGEARRYCYSGMGWGYAEDKFDNDYRLYLSTWIHKIERNYWPYAYEWMGEALERELRYDKATGAELKNYLDPKLASYFYSGVGRQAAREVHDNPKHALMDFRKKIDEEYEPFFYSGMGIELFDVLVDQPEKFFRFMNAVDKRFEPVIYAGLAQGKEYYRCIYDDFGFGIGKVGYNIGTWKMIMSKIEEKYKPLCYQRLGIEVGWRFIHDVTKYVLFLRAVDQEYRPYLYRGLGTGIGWRFAYNIEGCTKLIRYTDQIFWPYIYEGLGVGVMRRYNYETEGWVHEAGKIPLDYRSYFYRGTRDAR